MITIELPWPHPALAPNRANGLHWGELAGLKARAHSDSYLLAKYHAGTQTFSHEGKKKLFVTFHAPDKRRRDLDGCLSSIKQHLDGIAKALGIDDSQFGPVILDYVHGEKPGKVVVSVDA